MDIDLNEIMHPFLGSESAPSSEGMRKFSTSLSDNELQLILFRILSGRTRIRVNGESLYIHAPTPEAHLRACEAYEDAKQDAMESDSMDEQDALLMLYENNLWTDEEEELLQEIPKEVKSVKKQMFEKFFKDRELEAGRVLLNKVRNHYAELFSKRHQYDHMTVNGQAEAAKNRVLLACSLHNKNGTPLFTPDTVWTSNDSILEHAAVAYSQIRLTEAQLRKVARSDTWRGFYQCSSAEGKLFGIAPIFYTDEQRSLVGYTRLYHSISEHPDKPCAEAIDDDDVLDGWLIKQQEETESQSEQGQFDKKLSDKIKRCGEILIPVDSAKEAAKVHKLNSVQMEATRKQRFAHIDKANGEEVSEESMPDTRLKLRLQYEQMFRENLNKGK